MIIFRYSSRSLVIPFHLPTIGPSNDEEAKYFSELTQTMKNVSSSVGWAISLGSVLERKEHFEDGLFIKVKSRLPGVEPRLCTAYNTLVYCVSKVIIPLYIVSLRLVQVLYTYV